MICREVPPAAPNACKAMPEIMDLHITEPSGFPNRQPRSLQIYQRRARLAANDHMRVSFDSRSASSTANAGGGRMMIFSPVLLSGRLTRPCSQIHPRPFQSKDFGFACTS